MKFDRRQLMVLRSDRPSLDRENELVRAGRGCVKGRSYHGADEGKGPDE